MLKVITAFGLISRNYPGSQLSTLVVKKCEEKRQLRIRVVKWICTGHLKTTSFYQAVRFYTPWQLFAVSDVIAMRNESIVFQPGTMYRRVL